MNLHPGLTPHALPPRLVLNTAAEPATSPYGPVRAQVLDQAGFDAARAEISSWPGYAATPLRRLPGLAARLGLGQLLYKDERGRFGLGSFKALGGAYAVSRLPRGATVCCATDGNHGRAVAWGAQLFGCRCVIFVHPQVSQGRRDAIARYGAEVREVPGNYDDAVRQAAATAADQGWTVVSDTSWEGYRDIPRDVMLGYGVLAAEVVVELKDEAPPTHVLLQAGVGALAAAVCASFWLAWGARRPRCIVVEPAQADCVLRSLAAGHPVVVPGELDTVMAGLACGEVSQLAWAILQGGAQAAVALDDAWALEAMRLLARPATGDPAVVGGETGVAGLAALLALQQQPALRAQLGLDDQSCVLLIGSEGDTDPTIYRQVVGLDAQQVLAVPA